MPHAFVTVVVPFDTGLADAVEVHLDGLNVALQPLNEPAPAIDHPDAGRQPIRAFHELHRRPRLVW